MFLPNTTVNLKVVGDSFTNVVAMVAAARAQQSVAPSTYPMSPPETLKSRPEWFHPPYDTTSAIQTGPGILEETGDIAHNQLD